MKASTGFLKLVRALALGFAVSLVACGGGGDDPPPVVDPDPVPLPSATLILQGDTIEVTPGSTFTFVMKTNCPRALGVGDGTLCERPVGPVKLTFDFGTVPVTVNSVTYLNNEVTPPWNITHAAGEIRVSGTIGLNAMDGATSPITVLIGGEGNVELSGTPTKLTVKAPPQLVSVSNGSPASFVRTGGYGEFAHFSIACSKVGGCTLQGFRLHLEANAAPGLQVDTFIVQDQEQKSVWWFQKEFGPAILSGSESFSQYSEFKIGEGKTVDVSFRSTLSSGQVTISDLKLTSTADGTDIPVVVPPAPGVCGTVLSGLTKGC